MTDPRIPAGAREIAIATARDAGAILRDKLREGRTIQFKGLVDLVTDADRAVEDLVTTRLAEAFPDHHIIGEEASAEAGWHRDDRPCSWVIDPLDGTTNYAHGYPHFCTSIALEYDRQPILGVVYDPMLDELFVAERGGGATLNGLPMQVSSTDQLINALVATGFAYNIGERGENASVWAAFLDVSRGTRRGGAAALDLCYVAAGRLDAFWERPLSPWDMAAGALLVEEAGGTITGYGDQPFDLYAGNAIASNGIIHGTVCDLIETTIASRRGPREPTPR